MSAAAASSSSNTSGGAGDDPASLLDSFCALTGMGSSSISTNREFAESFLDGHDWNLERAVNAYLEMKADGNNGSANADDALDDFAQGGEEPVRAPIQQVTESLIDMDDSVMSLGLRPRIPSTRGRASAVDPFRNFAAEAQATHPTRRERTEADVKLATLFAPPDDLIFKHPVTHDYSFDGALAQAKAEHKFLVVNLQQGDVFASHQLNRDVWREKGVHSIVKSSFIFCQPNINTSSGQKFASLYHPPSVPAISIIDPLTRQRVWDCHQATKLRELVVKNSLVKLITATLKEFAAKADAERTANFPSTTPSNSVSTSIGGSAADEEARLLQAAIDASLHSSPTTSPVKAAKPSAPAAAAAGSHSISSSQRTSVQQQSKQPRGGANAPIVLDDDDDVEENSESYEVIDDSDAEFDTRAMDDDENDEDYSDHDVSSLPRQNGAKASVSHPNASSSSAAKQIGEKRKRSPINLEEEDESEKTNRKPSKVPRAQQSMPSPSAPELPLASISPSAPPAETVEVPAEPEPNAPNVCRLQVRLPGGKPAQRRFLKTDPMKIVYAFTKSLLPADSTAKPFLLVSALPRRELKDQELSIEAHGVANSSVILEWI